MINAAEIANLSRRYFAVIAALAYAFVGCYGALWVSDEFDRERQAFYAFFAIPATVLVAYLASLSPQIFRTRPRFSQFLVLLFIVSFGWGIFLLVNAATDAEPVTYTRLMKSRVEQRSLRVAYRRGGLGFLYRRRW